MPDNALTAYQDSGSTQPPAYSGNYDPKIDVNDLNPGFSAKLQKLQADALAAGIPNKLISGFRSVDLQAKLYANYQAKLAGNPLPHPELGSGGLAAPPGASAHNFGMAGDLIANDPKQQQKLIDMASDPSRGITALGAKDPPHFQDSSWGTPHGAQVPSPVQAGPEGQANPPAVAPAPTDQIDANSPGLGGGMNLRSLMPLLLLQAMNPNHQFTPVSYDPFKVMPKLG